MKKMLTNNAGLKVVSVVFAILFWLVVVNISDPAVTKTYSGIGVKVKDTDIITNNGKTFDIVGDSKIVNVTVTAKRSYIESIKASDIHASASMKNLTEGYLIPIEVKIDGYEGMYQSAEVNPVNLQVSIEDTASNKFPISVVTTGEVLDGYVIGNADAKPSAITISGAKSVINSISRVVVKVDVSGCDADAVISGDLIMYDKEENIIDQTQLNTNLGMSGAQVRIDMFVAKDVPLHFSASGNLKKGYVCSEIKCEPEEIRVAGDEKVIDEIESIDIPAQALNMNGASATIEKTIDITEYLPKDIILVNGETKNVAVEAVVEKLGTKTLSIASGSVIINNVPRGMIVTFKSLNDIELNFTGAGEVLDSLTLEKISASIDLAEFSEIGSYEVPLKVEMPEGCRLSKEKMITVILTKE